MKYVKMLGLAAVAAAALMAFVGAGSASATVLCKTNITTGCAGAWDYSGTISAATTGKAILKTTGGAVENECESSITGTASTGSSSTTVSSTITAANLTWKNCKFEPTKTLTGGTLEVHHVTGSAATVTASGFEVTTTLAGISCVYKSGNGLNVGTVTGGAPASIVVKTVVTSSTFFCPSTANWEGTYTLTNPTTTLHVAAS